MDTIKCFLLQYTIPYEGNQLIGVYTSLRKLYKAASEWQVDILLGEYDLLQYDLEIFELNLNETLNQWLTNE